MSEETTTKSTELPQVYKEVDLALMIELILNGLWSTTNLATALHITRDTVIEWKKRPEVQEAHRKAILKFIKKRTDTENVLKELDVEIKTDPTLIQINNYQQMTDGQLRELIAAKTRQLGVVVDATGVGETEEAEPLELPETAPETI